MDSHRKFILTASALAVTLLMILIGTVAPLTQIQVEFAVAGIVVFGVFSFFLLLGYFLED